MRRATSPDGWAGVIAYAPLRRGQHMTRGKGGCTTGIINGFVETMRDESDEFLTHPERKCQDGKIGAAGLVMDLMRRKGNGISKPRKDKEVDRLV